MNAYVIKYEPRKCKLKKGFETIIEAANRDEARFKFYAWYNANIKSIKLTKKEVS